MNWLKRSSRVTRAVMMMSLIVVGMVAGTALTAMGAPSSNTMYACVNKYNGDMRMPRSAGRCASTEFAVSWESYGGANLDGTYVNEGQTDSINSAMIVDGEIKDGDLSAALKTQFDDAYVNNGEADSVTSGMIVDGEIQSADLSAALHSDLDSEFVNAAELNSVTSGMIVDGEIQSADLSPALHGELDVDYVNAGEANSLTSGMIVDGQVTEVDLSSDVQTKLNTDNTGLTGVYSFMVEGAPIAAGGSGLVDGYCNPGDVAIGGGGQTSTPDMQLANSHRLDPNGWRALYKNNGSTDGTPYVNVVCATP